MYIVFSIYLPAMPLTAGAILAVIAMLLAAPAPTVKPLLLLLLTVLAALHPPLYAVVPNPNS